MTGGKASKKNTDWLFKAPPLATNCKNCAAPLDWNLKACEYCETFFVEPSAYHSALVYNPAAIDPRDLGRPIIPIKKSFWDELVLGGAEIAHLMLPRPRF